MRYTVLCTLVVLGCAPEGGGALPEDGVHELPASLEGKADNYISSNAREFNLLGTAHAKLPDDYATLDPEGQAAAVDKAVRTRLATVARSVRWHVDKVVRDSNGGLTGEDASWFTYFKRSTAEAVSPIVLADGRVSLPFQMELIGSVYLMSQLSPDTTGRRTFALTLEGWDGSDRESIEVEVRGSESRDAFPQYNKLFEDGVFDIGLHVGGDYNEERFDLDTAKWTVEYLLEGGWTNEAVSSFEDLRLDSPPFTRELKIEGRTVTAAVYIYHSDLDGGGDQGVLRNVMEESLAQRDVVIYSGHAGAGAGFLLDYHPRYELRAGDFATLPMSDKYQIFVLDGCQSYRTYVDDLLENPAKTFDNLDIITTVNTTPFSAGYQVIHEFLYWFTLTTDAGTHFPVTWKSLLRGINTRAFSHVHYGVHGIDSDPGLNPHSSEAVACLPCDSDADCKAGGNYCLGYPTGAACGVACAHDTACPDGYRCARLFTDPDLWYLPKQCVRRDYSCQ